MFSKKTRNLTVAVLALVMALTLTFGLFGFNTTQVKVDAAGTSYTFDFVKNGQNIPTITTENNTSGPDVKQGSYEIVSTEDPNYKLSFVYVICNNKKKGGTRSAKYSNSEGFRFDRSGTFAFTLNRKATLEIVVACSKGYTINIGTDANPGGTYTKDNYSTFTGNPTQLTLDTTNTLTLEQGNYKISCNEASGGGWSIKSISIKPEPRTYTVSFNLNGGTPAEGVLYNQMTYIEGDNGLTLPDAPEKTGSTFLGWYDGDIKVDTPYEPTGDNTAISLTAKWSEISYTTKFVWNGTELESLKLMDVNGNETDADLNQVKYNTTIKKVAKCNEKGLNEITATYKCLINNKEEVYKDSIDVETPATGHDFNVKPTWTVNGTTATATFTCKNGCGSTHVETVEIVESVVEPTETELGYKGQAATVTLNGNVYDYSSGVSEFIYHTTNEKMYAAQFVDVPVLSNYTYPEGWALTQESDTKGNDSCHYMGVDVYPLHLGNKVTPHGQITYTMPTTRSIEKIVVFAANLSDEKTTSMNVQIKDANGTSLYQTPTNIAINGAKQIAAYTVTPDAVAKNAKQVLITNGTGNAKLSVLEVCIYYAPFNVTVVDGDTTTNNEVYDPSYTLPEAKGVEGYQFVGWWNGTEFLANTTLTLTQDMTVTAVYANLEYTGASIKLTNGTGVRFGFALSLYNITDQTVLTNIAATITGKYVINTGKLNEIEVKSFRFGENGKLEMYFVMTNDFDAANNPTHAEYCGRELSVSLELNVNGNTVTANNANATYKTIASIATANATAEGASAELIAAAKKYGYVEA